MSLTTVDPFPTRQLYTYGVVLTVLFLMAFVWFIMYAVVVPVRTGIIANLEQYDVAGSTYGSFELANTFMANLWSWLLVFAVIVLLLWVYHYSQRKGTPMVMYE